MIALILPHPRSARPSSSFGISSAGSLPRNCRKGSAPTTCHAATSLLLAHGMPMTAASAMLGHAQASTMLNTYAHVLPGADRLTAEAMERMSGS
jgi:integrase